MNSPALHVCAKCSDPSNTRSLVASPVAGRSAGSALLTVSDEWHQILEQNAEVGTVFFDLKKAFNTVPHRSPKQATQYGL